MCTGTKEDLHHGLNLMALLSSLFLIYVFCLYTTGNAHLRRDFLKTGLEKAEKLKEEEEELYQKNVALAKLRMAEIPTKATPHN